MPLEKLRPFLLALTAATLAMLLSRIAKPNFLWAPQNGADSRALADLVVTNSVIYTSDSSLPFAEAMAVRKGRVLRVGNLSSIQDLIGENTRQLDLNGKVVVPGFIDSHVHLILGGLQMVRVDLRGVKSKEEFVSKVKEAAIDEWWRNFGIDDLELQTLAIRILSQTCSSSGCERNWSVFERIHTKRRNRLEHKRLNDLVYTHYNLRLKERQASRKSLTDPISLENIDLTDDWVVEAEDDDAPLLDVDEIDDWMDVADAILDEGEGGAAAGNEQGSWILGGGWNNELWGGDWPIASWIDDVTLNNPVWLQRMDGHMGLANSVSLKKAGITNCTENPVGGAVMRTADGEPTGLLVDSAMKLLFPWIPAVSISDRREAMLRASNLALMRGVTTVVDFGRYLPGAPVDNIWEDFSDVYQWADSSGKMRIRVCLFFPMETLTRLLSIFKTIGRVFSQWIYLGGVKAFADGSLGSNSALFYEPYVGEPNNYGLQVTDMNWLQNRTIESDNSGLQVAVHAIGDKANDLILDLNAALASTNGIRDRRFRIEHAQHLSPGTAIRFGEQKVIASVQPDHLLDDADSAAKKLGVNRAQSGSYLFKSLFSSNAHVAFGSDWPVADIHPLRSIKTAMKRVPPGWKNAWNPSECVTVDDALNAYTILAAYSCFLDDEVGSLSPGKLADFVVLSTDSWAEFAEEASASVKATYVGGMQAYP